MLHNHFNQGGVPAPERLEQASACLKGAEGYSSSSSSGVTDGRVWPPSPDKVEVSLSEDECPEDFHPERSKCDWMLVFKSKFGQKEPTNDPPLLTLGSCRPYATLRPIVSVAASHSLKMGEELVKAGVTDVLCFEQKTDKFLDAESLRSCQPNPSVFPVVYVAPCHSRKLGEELVKADVPHVICCEQETDKIMDDAVTESVEKLVEAKSTIDRAKRRKCEVITGHSLGGAMRSCFVGSAFSYIPVPGKIPFRMEHAGYLLGQVALCFVLPKERPIERHSLNFERDLIEPSHLVRVRMYNIKAVQEYLSNGGTKNPYTDIAVLLRGDNKHVLRSIETFKDEEWTYVVTPECEGGDLLDVIYHDAHPSGLADWEAREYFRRILESLNHLQKMEICHRDISPENIMIHNRRCLLVDFGVSLKVPYSPRGRRKLIQSQAACGKFPYMAPEIYRMEPFDGHTIDLWSAGTVLYEMATGLKLYNRPSEDDPLYDYYVIKQGITRWINPEIDFVPVRNQILESYSGHEKQIVERFFEERDTANQHLDQSLIDLLHKMLQPDPSRRLTLAEVVNHPWVMNQ